MRAQSVSIGFFGWVLGAQPMRTNLFEWGQRSHVTPLTPNSAIKGQDWGCSTCRWGKDLRHIDEGHWRRRQREENGRGMAIDGLGVESCLATRRETHPSVRERERERTSKAKGGGWQGYGNRWTRYRILPCDTKRNSSLWERERERETNYVRKGEVIYVW